MTTLAAMLGDAPSSHPLRLAFLKWQCRVRQDAMRFEQGRPGDGITPALFLPGEDEPMGHVITVLCKPAHSVTAELEHMAARTHDPAQRREQALRFLSATYYGKPAEFSDILTATFPPGSPGAARIRAAGRARLVFDAYGQRFDLDCKVWRLVPRNPHRRATMAHNRLFNPSLPPEAEVLGFEPDWSASRADPGPR